MTILSMFEPEQGLRLTVEVARRGDGTGLNARLIVQGEGGPRTVLRVDRASHADLVKMIDDIRTNYGPRGWFPQQEDD
jgi:hypothetical protein